MLAVPALTNAISIPFALLYLFLPMPAVALPMYVGVVLFSSAMLGPAMAATQSLAKVRMRATAAALVSLTVNLIGMGLGPFLVGVTSDWLRPILGSESIRFALLLAPLAALVSAAAFGLGARTLDADLAMSTTPESRT